MEAILQNPYRILGLLAGATAREQIKRVNKLKKYIEAEQEPEKDFSFPVLGKFQRTVDIVEAAHSSLLLDADKMNAALFWFYKGNDITDEPALEALQDGDIDAAYQIWNKLTTATKADGSKSWKHVTEKNYSAFHNCFVVRMLWAEGDKHNAVAENLYFLESEFCQKFVAAITDSTFKITAKELQINFLNEILREIEQKTVDITSGKFAAALKNLNFSAKEAFFATFISKKVEYIETKIKETRKKRKADKSSAAGAGEELYEVAGSELNFLKDTVGGGNIKYSSIADKVADEVLQCGIDYFLLYRDTDKDPSQVSMALFAKAKILAVGDYAQARCRENTENMQKWIDEAPHREKLKGIESDI